MRQAIVTKYVGPTNDKGSHIRLRSGGGLGMSVPWNYDLDVEGNHQAAVNIFADKYNWRNPGDGKRYEYEGGGIPGPWAYAFVQIEVKRARKGPAYK